MTHLRILLLGSLLLSDLGSSLGFAQPGTSSQQVATQVFTKYGDLLNCEMAKFLLLEPKWPGIETKSCFGCGYDDKTCLGDKNLKEFLQKTGFNLNINISQSIENHKKRLRNNVSPNNFSVKFNELVEIALDSVQRYRPDGWTDFKTVANKIKTDAIAELTTKRANEENQEPRTNIDDDTKTIVQPFELTKEVREVIEREVARQLKNLDRSIPTPNIVQKPNDSYFTYAIIAIALTVVLTGLSVWNFIKNRSLTASIDEIDTQVEENKKRIESIKPPTNSSKTTEPDPTYRPKNNDPQPARTPAPNVLDEAISYLKKNYSQKYTPELTTKIINARQNEWKQLIKGNAYSINKRYDGNQNQEMIDQIELSFIGAIREVYYSDQEEIDELLNTEKIITSNNWESQYPNISKSEMWEMVNNAVNRLRVKYSAQDAVLKKALNDELNDISRTIKEQLIVASKPKFVRKYSPYPTNDFFLIEKLSDEQDNNHHFYSIHIDVNNDNQAYYHFIYDNEKVVRTAIQSFSMVLEPVCTIENDHTFGTKIEPVDMNRPGLLQLENDKWRITRKLNIRII